jgi:ElaA protein
MIRAARIRVTDDIAACQALRRAVFIEEQGVAEADEVDGQDGAAVHLLASLDGVPVGTARLLLKGRAGKIGRVCVLAPLRGTGLGRALVEAAVEELRARGCAEAVLGAQVHAIGFYEGLGFVARGPVFDDAGIPHREMARPL